MIRALVAVALVVSVGVVWWAAGGSAAAGDAPATMSYTEDGVSPILAQEDSDGATASGGDSRIEVQTWTLIAAGGAVALTLLLFVLRVGMGWIERPTAEEIEAAKHH